MNKLFTISAISALLLLSSCSKDPSSTISDYQHELNNIASDVILPTYADLYEKTQALVNTLTILESTPNTANLEAAKQAWRDARTPWEQSEAFLFGPVDQKGLDPSIDSWPVNATDLDAVLSSQQTLTKAYIDGLDGTLKGFHTIEYLLFGNDGNKQVADFTPRQFEYLRACAQSLNGATESLYFSWKPDHDNFIANILNAGKSGSIYPSQKSALQEIINGLVAIADEVANGKINDPYSQQNLTLEESRFSANSKKDFADNIRSIKNAYIGQYRNSSGLGISTIISAKNPTLDIKVRQQTDDAIFAIEAIQGTFTSAIFNAPQSVETAREKVRTLQQTLESEVLPIISNL